MKKQQVILAFGKPIFSSSFLSYLELEKYKNYDGNNRKIEKDIYKSSPVKRCCSMHFGKDTGPGLRSGSKLNCVESFCHWSFFLLFFHVQVQRQEYSIHYYGEKRELNAFAKSIDLCQPAQSAQAYMGRNFLLSFSVCHVDHFTSRSSGLLYKT